VIYQAEDNEALIFIMGTGHGSWGNTPGPPTSNEPMVIRGVNSRLTVTASGQYPPFFDASWREHGTSFQVKASSRLTTSDELKRIIESLTEVR
jgi:hypothetical protein